MKNWAVGSTCGHNHKVVVRGAHYHITIRILTKETREISSLVEGGSVRKERDVSNPILSNTAHLTVLTKILPNVEH